MSLVEKLSDCRPKENPLEPADYTEFELHALRALWRGEADPRQQKVALEWFLRACGKDDQTFRPDARMSDFACGKRHAALELMWMLKAAPTRTDPDKIAARSAGEANERKDNR